MRYVPVNSTVTFRFPTNAAAGGLVAPSTAFEVADVRIYKDASATERSSTSGWTMTSPFDSVTGFHQISIDLSDNTDAGFYAKGSNYEVWLIPDTETVDSQTVGALIGEFHIGPIPADVLDWNGTAIPGVDTAGYPKVTIKDGTGTGEIDTSSGVVLANVTKWNGTAVTDLVNDVLHSGTAQGGSSTTIQLASGASAVDDAYKYQAVIKEEGGVREYRIITGYVGATKTATVDRAWNDAATSSSTYAVVPDETAYDLSIIKGYIDTEVAAILAAVDTEVAAIKAKTDSLTFTSAGKVDAKLTSDGVDNIIVESGISAGAGLTNDTGTQLTSINLRQASALFASALAAVLAGAATTSVTVKQAGKPSGNTRITATVDSNGNRSAVTLKVPD